jgi:glutamyl-tRNA synthetase
MKDLVKKARAYALKNAVIYGGKAQKGAVISGLFNEGLKKNEVGKYVKQINEVVKEVNKISVEEQKKEFEKTKKMVSERKVREGLPDLPGAKKGKVIMRFAPSASGPFHVGHAATACISFLFVKKYGGKFYVRIEDTNPENIYPLAYKMIAKESKWLFDGIAKIVIQSDRMDLYYKYVEKLIKKKVAYVCVCSSEDFREFVSEKKNCPCRKLDINENLERWKKMLTPKAYPDKFSKKISTKGNKKGFGEGEAVLRFKSNMKHKNPAMRDFPLARINLTKHFRQKNKYRVWPLMNLAVAVDDIEMKMTHIIRAKDHRDNSERQKLIYKALGLEKEFPWTAFLGRIKFKDMDLSTTKIQQAISLGKYSGWDDEELPTIASLKKKYKPEVFWKFAERVGFSENDKVIDRKEYFRLLDCFR